MHELGEVFGVAVLAVVIRRATQSFVDGFAPALWVATRARRSRWLTSGRSGWADGR